MKILDFIEKHHEQCGVALFIIPPLVAVLFITMVAVELTKLFGG